MTQGERYQYLVEHQEGGKVTNYYRSAFYLLSATQELFEKSKKFAQYGIDFTPIKAKLFYHDQMLSVMVEIAENLYTAQEHCKITPRHIALLPEPYFDLVVRGMEIASGKCKVEVVEGEFDFSYPYDQKQEPDTF